MTIAIKFGDSKDPKSISGVIYFDAVTKYDKKYGGKTTSHPLEVGASITDHYISDNKKYKVEGVVSHVDFSPIPTMVTLEEDPVTNKNNPPIPVQVVGGGNLIDMLMPDVISQFLGANIPEVIMDESERVNFRDMVEDTLERILHGVYYNEEEERLENRMTLITLFEMEGSGVNPTKTIQDLVITNFEIKEDPETGDALFFQMDMEQVSYVMLKDAEAPEPAQGSKESRTTSGTKDNGNIEERKESTDSPITASGQGSLVVSGGQ